MPDKTGIFGKADDKDFLATTGREPAVAALVAAGGSAALSASSACLTRLKAPRALALTKLVWVSGTQSGNYDIGLYDAAGTRLWSKGSTASPAANTTTVETFTAVNIPKGALFYVALAADNATATFRAVTLVSAELTKTLGGVATTTTVAAAFPLPSTITVGTTTVLRIPLVVLRES